MADGRWHGHSNPSANFGADPEMSVGWNHSVNGYSQQQQQQQQQQPAAAAPPPYPVNGSLMPEPRFDWNVTSPWGDGDGSGGRESWGGMTMPTTLNYFDNFPHAFPTSAAYPGNVQMAPTIPPHFQGPPAVAGGATGISRPNNSQSVPYPMMTGGYTNGPMPAINMPPQQNPNNYVNYGGANPNSLSMPGLAPNLIAGGRVSPGPPQRPTNFGDSPNYPSHFNPGGHFGGGRVSPAMVTTAAPSSPYNLGGYGQNSMPSAPPMSPEREMTAEATTSPLKMPASFRAPAPGMPQQHQQQQQQPANFDGSHRGSGAPPYRGGDGIGGQPKSPIPDDIPCAHCHVPNANFQIICVACHRPIRG